MMTDSADDDRRDAGPDVDAPASGRGTGAVHGSDPAHAPDPADEGELDLAARYGQPPGRLPTPVLAAIGAAGVVLLAYLVWAALHFSTPDVRAGLLGFEVVDETSVRISIEVVRDPAVPVTCAVRAQNADNVTVGSLDIAVPTGRGDTVAVGGVIPTRAPAVNGELVGCTVDAGGEPAGQRHVTDG
jgi:hypothetical protein